MLTLDYDILNSAAANDWLVVGTQSHLTAIDAETGSILWKKTTELEPDAGLVIYDDVVVTIIDGEIRRIAKSGNELEPVKLTLGNTNAELLTSTDRYAFVKRLPGWVLEVYDLQEGKLSWSQSIDRGSRNINNNPNTNIVYMTSLDGIQAIKGSTGDVIWELPEKVMSSVYDADILYYLAYTQNEKSMQIVSYDVKKRKENWRSDISEKASREPFAITLLGDKLFAISQTSMIALDKPKGNQLWQLETGDQFFPAPVQLGDVLYVKAPIAKKVYAVSSKNGEWTGNLQFEPPSVLAQSAAEFNSGIFSFGDSVAFSGTNHVYSYGK
jgi:outer membrane protein assembly factor BamB